MFLIWLKQPILYFVKDYAQDAPTPEVNKVTS